MSDPQPIRCVGDEPPLHQMGVHRRRWSCSAVLAPLADHGQAVAAWGGPLAYARTPSPGRDGVRLAPAGAVGAAGGGVHLGDGNAQLVVGDLAGAGRAETATGIASPSPIPARSGLLTWCSAGYLAACPDADPAVLMGFGELWLDPADQDEVQGVPLSLR